jgi:hypothetical protein
LQSVRNLLLGGYVCVFEALSSVQPRIEGGSNERQEGYSPGFHGGSLPIDEIS